MTIETIKFWRRVQKWIERKIREEKETGAPFQIRKEERQ